MANEGEMQAPLPGENDGMAEANGTAVAVPKKKPAPAKRTPGQLPPYKVLLHNDDVNDFGHVLRAIVQLTSLQKEEAVQKMLEAHKTGLALLLVTHKERAELYQEQFASLSLTVTIEPDA